MNRAYIIENLYRSLCNQTFKDFEWLIIDQGTDDTEMKVNQFIKVGIVQNVRYYKSKDRTGINRAMNDAIEIAGGELFFKVDDDDYLTNDALELIDSWEKNLPKDKSTKYAGVSGLRAYHDGKIIGGEWKHLEEYIDATGLERRKFSLLGDKAEAYYTKVLRDYGPIPEIVGETLTFESLLYDKIADAGFKIRWFNHIIYFTEYLPDGATRNTRARLEKNLGTYSLLLQSYLKYKSQPHMYVIKNLCRYSEMCRRKGMNYDKAFLGFNEARIITYVCWKLSLITKFIKPRNEFHYQSL